MPKMKITFKTRPKPFVFVLMPFSAEFNDIYSLGIKAACAEAGAYCERVDEQVYDENILERIYNQIAKADFIVADMSGKNPNVFYEVGYAHALGKKVVLLTKKAADIPFDLKHYPHIVYGAKGGEITKLKTELTKRVSWLVKNPTKAIAKAQPVVEVFIDGVNLTQRPTVQLAEGYKSEWLQLAFHNPTNQTFDAKLFKIGLITPKAYKRALNIETEQTAQNIVMPDSKILHLFEGVPSLFPKMWHSLPISFRTTEPAPTKTQEFCVRIFSEVGFSDFPFKARPPVVSNEF
jgi:hypothetical protein